MGRRVVANCGPNLDLILCVGSAGAEVRDSEVVCGAVRADQKGLAAGGSSIRELAVWHHVHRRTVRQALASAVPPPRKAYPRRPRPAIGPYAAVIEEWLVADRDVPPEQRHTARRIW